MKNDIEEKGSLFEEICARILGFGLVGALLAICVMAVGA